MIVYSIVRTFFDANGDWEYTTMADTYKVLSEANEALLGIVVSLIDSGAEYVGTYNLEYLANTRKIEEKHATIVYPDKRMEIIAILKNWLY